MAEDDYVSIDCNVFDYVEAACLYRYPVRLRLVDGGQVDGTAVDTRAENGGEFLVLDVDGRQEQVRLDRIAVLETRIDGAKFTRVPFRA
jgi:Rho-binding antiterminator